MRNYKIGNDYKIGRMIRDGAWKIVPYNEGPRELYDLFRDRTEIRNLAAAMPEKVGEMKNEYDLWERHCCAGL